MDIIFITLALMSAVLTVLLIGGGIMWCIERITWKHLSIAGSLISTIVMLSATCYALWTAFGWWILAYIGASFIHGLFTGWFVFNHDRASFNRPIYRVGGGHDTPRLHR